MIEREREQERERERKRERERATERQTERQTEREIDRERERKREKEREKGVVFTDQSSYYRHSYPTYRRSRLKRMLMMMMMMAMNDLCVHYARPHRYSSLCPLKARWYRCCRHSPYHPHCCNRYRWYCQLNYRSACVQNSS